MSKVRGVLPLFLVTGIGIANGLYVFGPTFKEQQQKREEETKKALEAPARETIEIQQRREAEAIASRVLATEAALKPLDNSSWWPSFSMWSRKSVNKDITTPRDAVPTEQKKTAAGKD